MRQQVHQKAEFSTMPPSRGTPVGNNVRGGRLGLRRYNALCKFPEEKIHVVKNAC